MAVARGTVALGWCIALPPPAPAILDGRLLAVLSRHFNCALVLQGPVLAPDGQGGQSRTWAPRYKVNAAIEALTGAEKLAFGAIGVNVTHRILMPYQLGIDPTFRGQYGTRIFEIHTVIDYSEQHLVLELMAEERLNK